MPDPLDSLDSAEGLEKQEELLLEVLNVEEKITEQQKLRVKTLKELTGLDTGIELSLTNQLDIQRRLLEEEKNIAKSVGEARKKYLEATEAEKPAAQDRYRAAKAELAEKVRGVEIAQKQINLLRAQLEEIKQRNNAYKQGILSLTKTLGLSAEELDNFSKYSNLIKEHFPSLDKWSRRILTTFIVIAVYAFKLFNSFEKAAAAFRRTMGLMRGQDAIIRKMAEQITIQFTHAGVKIDDVYKSVVALGSEMGGVHNVTRDLAVTTSLLQSQLGVSEENTAGMMRNLAAISKSTMQSQKDMVYFTAALSEAGGVPLNLVMGDIAKMSSTAYTMVSKMPLAIIKTAVEARKLNTTLNDMAKASEHILDFTTNVQAEMEASVLIGRSINLQRARELAYRKDILGSTKEILKIAHQIDFENLDVFQMRAFANATGRSVEELMKMIQAEKQMEEARRDPNLAKQVAAYEQLKAANEATARDSAKNLELMIQQRANQERLVSIQNRWNQIWMHLSKVLLPLVDRFLWGIEKVLGFISNILGSEIGQWMITIVGSALLLYSFIKNIIKVISILFNGIKSLSGGLKTTTIFGSKLFQVMSRILGIVGPIARIGTFFSKWVFPLGWVILGLQTIWSTIKHITKWLKGEEVIGDALYGILFDVIISPFKAAWEWIKSIFIGQSPSQLALGIVKGIASISTMLFDVLTEPFRRSFAWIADKIPGMGKLAEKIRGGLSGMVSGVTPVENKVAAAYIPAVEFKATPPPKAETIEQARVTKQTADSIPSESDKTLNDILIAINNLNKNLESGKIGVYIDGQLMSATLSRQINFKGGFGMNVA